MCDDASLDMFDFISEVNGDALSIEGYDDCIIGICHFYSGDVIAYDKKKMVDKIAQSGSGHLAGMGIEEAEECFERDIRRDCNGDINPVFITRLDET